MDKLAFGGAMAARRRAVAAPRRRSRPTAPDPEFAGPYIVKPRFGGSSIGIEITDDLGALPGALVRTSPHFRDGAVVEPYLPDAGSTSTCRCAPGPSCELSAHREAAAQGRVRADLLLRRQVPRGGEGLSGRAPGAAGGAARRRRRAGPGPGPAGRRAGAACGASPASTSCGGGDDVWVNEINTIPGVDGLLPLDRRGRLVRRARSPTCSTRRRGPVRRTTTDGADGTALRSAGSIAGKLA